MPLNAIGDCDKCLYWAPKDEKRGSCRRYAPRPAIDVNPNSLNTDHVVWPTTEADCWCGEFAGK